MAVVNDVDQRLKTRLDEIEKARLAAVEAINAAFVAQKKAGDDLRAARGSLIRLDQNEAKIREELASHARSRMHHMTNPNSTISMIPQDSVINLKIPTLPKPPAPTPLPPPPPMDIGLVRRRALVISENPGKAS